jgi:hypothetical protein
MYYSMDTYIIFLNTYNDFNEVYNDLTEKNRQLYIDCFNNQKEISIRRKDTFWKHSELEEKNFTYIQYAFFTIYEKKYKELRRKIIIISQSIQNQIYYIEKELGVISERNQINYIEKEIVPQVCYDGKINTIIQNSILQKELEELIIKQKQILQLLDDIKDLQVVINRRLINIKYFGYFLLIVWVFFAGHVLNGVKRHRDFRKSRDIPRLR